MTSALVILAVAAFGTVAMAQPYGEQHGREGGPHFGPPGDHRGGPPFDGPHGGPPFAGPHGGPPFGGPGNGKFLRMKMLHFVHETLCYGLPGPNFTRGGNNNDAARAEHGPPPPHHNGQRPPQMSPAAVFRALVTRGVDNTTTGQNFTNTPAVTNTTNTNNSSAVEAEEARLIRVIARQVMSMWTLPQGGDADAACAQLTAAEQKLIDFRKANNLTCDFEKQQQQGRFPGHPFENDHESPMFHNGNENGPHPHPEPHFNNNNNNNNDKQRGRPARASEHNGREGHNEPNQFPEPHFGNNEPHQFQEPHFNHNNGNQQQQQQQRRPGFEFNQNGRR